MSAATVKGLAAQLPELIAQADALVTRAERLLGAADELAKLIDRAAWHARGLPGVPLAGVPVASYVAQRLAEPESDQTKNFRLVEPLPARKRKPRAKSGER